jgi:hypothetical protein
MLKIFIVIIFLSLTLKNLNLNAEEENDDEETCLEMSSWKEFKKELEIKFQDAESELNSYVLFIYLEYKFKFFLFYLVYFN